MFEAKVFRPLAVGVVALVVGLVACAERVPDQFSPIGAWEVADPEGTAQAMIRNMKDRDDDRDWAIPLSQYLDIFRNSIKSLVLEFKEDGTVMHSDKGPWKTATWKRTGDQVIVRVERYGDTPIPMGIEYRLRGETLVETGILYDDQASGSRGPQSSGQPEVVLRRSSRSTLPR